MLYVGVDAHKTTSHVTVMDGAGKVLQRTQVPTSLRGLHEALDAYDEPMKAVVEASHGWGPIYDWLDDLTDEVILAHPAKVRAIADARIKTDKIDSETLAHLLRSNLIPAAYAPSKGTRAVKRVLGQRMFLVRVQIMMKNRIHALLHQHSLEPPATSDLFGRVGLAWLRTVELPASDHNVLDSDLTLLSVIKERIRATNALLDELSAGDEAIQWLRSLPGIGDFFSVLIRYEVDDIDRFPSAKRSRVTPGWCPPHTPLESGCCTAG